MTLRDRIADLIRADGRTQCQIAESAGIGQTTVAEIVTGRRSVIRAETAARLARSLGLSATALGRLLYETIGDD